MQKAGATKKNPLALKGSLFDREKQTRPRESGERFMAAREEIASDIRAYREVGVDTMIFDVRRPRAAAKNVGAMDVSGQGSFSQSLGRSTLNKRSDRSMIFAG